VTRFLLLVGVLAACKPNQPAPNEAKTVPTVQVAPGQVAPVGTVAPMPPPDPREKALAGAVLGLLESEHLLHKKLDDAVSRLAFKTYIDALDGGKMFLLKSDRAALEKYADTIDDQLRSGSLDIAHDGSKLFVQRVAVVEKLVATTLTKPLDMTNEEFVELDPDKLDLAADETELAERWRKRLELEMLERVNAMEARLQLEADRAKAKAEADKKAPKGAKAAPKDVKKSKDPAGADATKAPTPADQASDDDDEDEDKSTLPVAQIPTTPEGREAKAREELAKTYAGRFARMKTPAQLDAAAELVNSVTAALDPHTTYLPPADKANFDIRMTGSLEGIGAVLREKEHLIEIVEVVPGGASWRHGGLTQGDLILSVQQEKADPVDVFDMRIDEVVKMIRGPKGTVVRLRIQKATGQEQTIAITRDVVVIEESYAKGAIIQQKGKPAMGYIHLPSFYGGRGSPRTSAEDIKNLLADLKAKKVGGVILDIRSNGGGLLGDSIEMTGHLIDQGPVVQVKDSDGTKDVLSDSKRGVIYDGPVIVLIDRFSASASEILAGALQDYGRALIVGTNTHGKGTVQTIADLDRVTGGQQDLGVIKITIQQFFRPSGSSVQLQGVAPDIALPDPAAHIESGEKTLDHAIAWSQIPPSSFTKWGMPWDVKALAAKSATRVAKHPLLTKISAATAVLAARKDDTRVPLQKLAWETRRKEQKAALEAASPDLKKAPSSFTVKSLGDVVVPAPPSPNGNNGKAAEDKAERWRDNLSKDPWVEECLSILGDMTTPN
jgi:carboxyl-terminal processing protease